MTTLKICLGQFLAGFKDSLFGFIRFFKRQKLLSLAGDSSTQQQQQPRRPNALKNNKNNSSNEKLRQRLFQSCILNGIFLLCCILAFNYLLMPSLAWVQQKLLSEKYHKFVTEYFNPLINLVFSFVWIIPVFLLSKIFNVLCHQDIADIAYMQKYGSLGLAASIQSHVSFDYLLLLFCFCLKESRKCIKSSR